MKEALAGRLHDQVVDRLGRLILRAEILPGAALPTEADLGAQLGVSRTVVREAIKVLAAKGLIEVRPKTGTRVLPRDHWNLLDPDVLNWHQDVAAREEFFHHLSEVRAIIEPAAARLAAQRASAAEIADLTAWCQRMELAVADTQAFITADLRFHAAIVAAAHNPILRQTSNTIGDALRASRALTTQVAGATRAALPLHRAVMEAIVARNADAAQARMADLIGTAIHDIDTAFRSNGSREDQP